MAHMMRPASVAFGMKRKVEVRRPTASNTKPPEEVRHHNLATLRKKRDIFAEKLSYFLNYAISRKTDRTYLNFHLIAILR